LWIAGLLVGLAVCFTQHHGALAALAFGGFILWEGYQDSKNWRHILRREFDFFLPFSAIVATCVGFIAFEAGFGTFLYSTVVFPISYCGSLNPWSNNVYEVVVASVLRGNVHLLQSLALAILVPWIYVIAITSYIYQRPSRPAEEWRRLVLVSAVGCGMFISVSNAPTVLRMATISLPAFLVLVWLLNQSTKGLLLLWVIVIVLMVKDLGFSQSYGSGYIDSPSGRIEVPWDMVTFYRWLAHNTHPDEYVFDAAGSRVYYWFRLQNPTRLWWLTSCEFTRPEQVAEAQQDVAKKRTNLILWYVEGPDRICPETGNHLRPMTDYMHAHFRRIKEFQRLKIAVWESRESDDERAQ
jgi:hypothetical protein